MSMWPHHGEMEAWHEEMYFTVKWDMCGIMSRISAHGVKDGQKAKTENKWLQVYHMTYQAMKYLYSADCMHQYCYTTGLCAPDLPAFFHCFWISFKCYYIHHIGLLTMMIFITEAMVAALLIELHFCTCLRDGYLAWRKCPSSRRNTFYINGHIEVWYIVQRLISASIWSTYSFTVVTYVMKTKNKIALFTVGVKPFQ